MGKDKGGRILDISVSSGHREKRKKGREWEPHAGNFHKVSGCWESHTKVEHDWQSSNTALFICDRSLDTGSLSTMEVCYPLAWYIYHFTHNPFNSHLPCPRHSNKNWSVEVSIDLLAHKGLTIKLEREHCIHETPKSRGYKEVPNSRTDWLLQKQMLRFGESLPVERSWKQ